MKNCEKECDGCQLKVVYESGYVPTFVDNLRSFLLRVSSSMRRRIEQRSTLEMLPVADGAAVAINKTVNVLTTPPSKLFEAGDVVEVLSMEEIKKTLDERKRCGRLEFMPGMDRYAGKRFTVLKNVKTIFDERAQKMVGVKNTVLLKNVICDGRDMYDKEGCDRSCYYFWKVDWLKKVE